MKRSEQHYTYNCNFIFHIFSHGSLKIIYCDFTVAQIELYYAPNEITLKNGSLCIILLFYHEQFLKILEKKLMCTILEGADFSRAVASYWFSRYWLSKSLNSQIFSPVTLKRASAARDCAHHALTCIKLNISKSIGTVQQRCFTHHNDSVCQIWSESEKKFG